MLRVNLSMVTGLPDLLKHRDRGREMSHLNITRGQVARISQADPHGTWLICIFHQFSSYVPRHFLSFIQTLAPLWGPTKQLHSIVNRKNGHVLKWKLHQQRQRQRSISLKNASCTPIPLKLISGPLLGKEVQNALPFGTSLASTQGWVDGYHVLVRLFDPWETHHEK
jgi:hypothetical protein